uniref:KY-like immunoglobulin-like domain-containing protein n=1 Tax=Magallana gigas TaxID=29159 RepID=A0A8W8JWX8_MAGGI
MGCCVSTKISPVENIEREDEGSKTGEQLSNEDFGENDNNQIKKETQLVEYETSRRNEGLLGYNSSSTSSDLVAKTEEGGLRNHDRERTGSIDHDKYLQSDFDMYQTFNRSTESRLELLANETTEREEIGEDNLFGSFGDSKEISKEDVLSEIVSMKKDDDDDDDDDDDQTLNEAQQEEPLTYKEEISNDSLSASSDLVSKTENNSDTENEKKIEHDMTQKVSLMASMEELMMNLCFSREHRIAGLPVKNISGFSKAFGYSPEDHFTPLTKTDHAWNAVRIDGHWRFVECTWGAGFLDQNNSFQKKLEPFYFFTEPKHFINAHFPWKSDEEGFSKLWQLLDNPISLDTYNKALKLEHSALIWNVFPLTHKESIVEAHEEIVIEIGDKDEVLCGTVSRLYNMKTGLFCNEFIFLRQERSGVFSISIRPPSNGKYKLTIYGQVDRSEEKYELLMTYLIRFSNVSKTLSAYPQNNGQMWGMNLTAFDNGFLKTEQNRVPIKNVSGDGFVDKTFATTRSVPTVARIIPATKTLSLKEEKYCLVTVTQTTLNIKACFPDIDLYKLELMCKEVDENGVYYNMACEKVNKDNKYPRMACFLIECTKPADPCLGYPTAFPEAVTFCCKLIEPLSAQLPANTAVTCRFRSPLVVKAMVSYMDTEMTQDGDEWSCTVTTPSSGINFVICGDVDDASSNSFCGLFQYDII